MIVLLRTIAVIIILWLALGFIKNILLKIYSLILARKYRGGGQIAEMVKDPVCGSYVSLEHAVKVTQNGADYYFCSVECSEKIFMKK